MNDNDIRKILISYLQAQGKEMRIYQEKSIGSSICDVMVVTDRLTGYEIKSDVDNYSRLSEQVKAYNLFFDENYIVVSRKHQASAVDKVPSEWGIICIEADNVTVFRKAKTNKDVIRRKQLSILWKLELKNILIKNNMPLYAQKEKGYIADRIADQLDPALLGNQIAYELLHRDYSVFDATDYSIRLQAEEIMPATELVDMLSENDLEEFTLDKWINLYKQAKEMKEKKECLFVEPPKERVAHDIPYTDIEVSLGAPWISVDIINDFISHLLKRQFMCKLCMHEPITGNWHIDCKKSIGDSNYNSRTVYGTPRYNALFILEATLNLREIKLYDKNNKYNEGDTVAAIEKKKKIEDEFKNWIWLDEDRRWEVEEAYNKLFIKYTTEHYDGSKLTFPHMSPDFELYPYQKDAVQKILTSKNTLLAFDVGAGKTFIMIAAAMKMRQNGVSRKNMFVVPNHIVGQWEKIFTELYPRAKVLAIEPKTFKPEMRGKVLSQIKKGDYDGIIIAYSCFDMIPLASSTVLNNMSGQLDMIENAVRDMRRYSYTYWQSNELKKARENLIKMTNDFINSMSYTVSSDITFEDLEISTLFLDEAHNYKNLPIKTQLKNLNGINTKGSSKCLGMLHKIRCVQNNSESGRGAVFATGTPLCNSISDAYAMQMYLQYDELEKTELHIFDNWVKTFAKPEQLCEIDVDTSKYRMIWRFSHFHNLPELSKMFSQIAIFYAVNDNSALPDFKGYTDVVIKKHKALTKYMKRLCDRTELIRSGIIDRKADNMLKVSIDGRKAALDLKLVGEEQPCGKRSKIDNCVTNVFNIYNNHPKTTQLIFCDYSTPKGEDFSVYKELKEKLSGLGIPEKEIAFIHSYNTESRKVELFRKFNNAEVRVLIGSTFKLGIGANVQVKLKAVHHLDVPWRPADMVQREGRIIRRGNENENVLIYRYIAEGSFDSYSWQILETKQKFISQFLSGSSYQRSVSDLDDNVLSYAEVKALALSQPLMKQLAEKENEFKALKIIIAKEKESHSSLKKELNQLGDAILKLYKRCNANDHILAHTSHYSKKLLADEWKKISEIFTDELISGKEFPENGIDILCFTVKLPELQSVEHPYIFLCANGEKYKVDMGDTPNGNARRIINFIKNFGKTVDLDQKAWSDTIERENEIRTLLDCHDDTNERKLRECEAELEQIRQLIEIKEKEIP